MKALTGALACLFCLMLVLTASAEETEMEKLKKRFKKRYPTLLKLKDAGKVGENAAATVEAVKAAYLKEKATDQATVGSFIADENKDRQRLYVLMAKQAETTPEKVIERAVLRNRSKAAPEHYLKLKSGKWVKKKDYKRDPR